MDCNHISLSLSLSHLSFFTVEFCKLTWLDAFDLEILSPSSSRDHLFFKNLTLVQDQCEVVRTTAVSLFLLMLSKQGNLFIGFLWFGTSYWRSYGKVRDLTGIITANYLSRAGRVPGMTWGLEIQCKGLEVDWKASST